MDNRVNQERSIFEQAAQIATEPERSAFLDKACGENAQLRARLEALLEGHFKANGFRV